MTICYFSAQYLPTVGGVERYTWNLARRTVAAGHRAIVVTSALPNLPEHEIDGDGIEIYRLPVWPVMNGRFPVIKPGARFHALTAQIWAQKLDFCVVQTRMYTQSVWAARAAKRRGVNVTCETAPHYLAFTQDDLQEDGRFKMNPPLRDQADQDALIEGLLDGTIDMLVTDHAPHSAEEKSRGLEKSAMGIVGLETAFPLLYTYLVKPGVLSLDKLVALLHTNPCRRFGIPTGGTDCTARDFTGFDLHAAYTIDPEEFQSMGRATPFTGWSVQGRCLLTVAGGKVAWRDETLCTGGSHT